MSPSYKRNPRDYTREQSRRSPQGKKKEKRNIKNNQDMHDFIFSPTPYLKPKTMFQYFLTLSLVAYDVRNLVNAPRIPGVSTDKSPSLDRTLRNFWSNVSDCVYPSHTHINNSIMTSNLPNVFNIRSDLSDTTSQLFGGNMPDFILPINTSQSISNKNTQDHTPEYIGFNKESLNNAPPSFTNKDEKYESFNPNRGDSSNDFEEAEPHGI